MNQSAITGLVDQPGKVRDGEELDAAKLQEYLHRHFDRTEEPLQILQYPSGHSNLTFALRLGDRKVVLRRPPFGSKVKSAHDMGREFRVLSKLHAAYAPAPKVLLYCDDLSILGAPFYLMEPIEGLILRSQLPAGMDFSADVARRLSESFLDNLVTLHCVDYTAAELGDLGRPQGYVERQVRGWTERYFGSKTHDYPEVAKIASWMEQNMPSTSGVSLIHNDYKYDNVVLDTADVTKIIGVLDWEMSTIGDSLADLGTMLAYWAEASDPEWIMSHPDGPTACRGSLTRLELVQRYSDKTRADVSEITFYLAFARFKIAVILQQIYYRYHQGLTHDPRFAELPERIEVFLQGALRCAQSGKI